MRILIISDNDYIGNSILKIINSSGGNDCFATLTGSSKIDMDSEDQILEIVENNDLIISAHCKKIFPAFLINKIRCINIHPGFNPYNRGWFPQVFSINNKLPAGATIHEIDEFLDHGSIIIREEVKVENSDTSLSLYEKIIGKEIELFSKILPDLISNRISLEEPEIEGNLNYKSDFNKLCNLDMDSIGTLRSHIDLLRSLTHGEYANAFFTDDDGKKIYVTIKLKKDVQE